MMLYFCAYAILVGGFAGWLPTYIFFVWKCDLLERRGAERFFAVQARIEKELKESCTGRYATLLEDDRTEGYIAGLQAALELASAVQAEPTGEKNESA